MASSAQRSGLRNVNRLRRKLRKMPDDIRKEVQAAVAETAELVRQEAISRIDPSDKDLRQSIEVKLSGDKLAAQIGSGARTKKAYKLAGWRAHWTEFGTRPHSLSKGASLGGAKKREKGQSTGAQHPGQAARPYLLPGLKAAAPKVIKKLDEAVDKALRAAAADTGADE